MNTAEQSKKATEEALDVARKGKRKRPTLTEYNAALADRDARLAAALTETRNEEREACVRACVGSAR